MAVIGCKHPCFAPFNGVDPANAMPSYGDGVVLGRLISANLTINNATGEEYSDDAMSDSISEFASGSLAMETNDLADAAYVAIYNATLANSEVVDSVNDVIPNGGLAYYKKIRRNGATKYQCCFYPKVRAVLGNDNAQTKGNSINFQSEALTFTILAPNAGNWRYRATFDTEAAAIAWVESKVNVAAYHVVNIQKSGTGTVSPDKVAYVPEGENLVITFSTTPSAVYDNGADVTSSVSSKKYTITAVSEDHDVIAAFTA